MHGSSVSALRGLYGRLGGELGMVEGEQRDTAPVCVPLGVRKRSVTSHSSLRGFAPN